MPSFEVTPEQLPAVVVGMGVQGANLSSFLHGVAPYMLPAPTGFHAPGAYISAGFGIVEAVLSTYLETGIVETQYGKDAVGSASVTFEATDTVGSVAVQAVDALSAPAFGS